MLVIDDDSHDQVTCFGPMKCERFTCNHLLQRHWEPVGGSFCSSLPPRPWNSVLRWSFLEPGTCVTTMSRTVLLMCSKLQTFIVTGHGDVHVAGYGSRT